MSRATKSRMTEAWEPDEKGQAYAAERGVPDDQVEAFRDYWLGRGEPMADWSACWRTWCRNSVRFGVATGRPIVRKDNVVSLFDVAQVEDPWGINATVAALPDATDDRNAATQIAIKALGGWDVVASLTDICQAAGLPRDWRGDLGPVCDWLREGLDPDLIAAAIRGARRPDKPGAWRWFDARVREWVQRGRG